MRSMKPQAVCVPFPAQGHITPMLKLAVLLHSKGFHITFVHTEYNHGRLLRSRGPSSLDGLPDFRFETIPDGLPKSEDADVTQDIPSLCKSTMTSCSIPFRSLLAKLNSPSSAVPPVTCIISDSFMTWTLDVVTELGIREVLLWPPSACSFVCSLHYIELIHRGLTPLKDMSCLGKAYLEMRVEGVKGMEVIRFRDFPSFLRTADPNDFMLNFIVHELSRASRASAIIINTFDDLEGPFLEELSARLPSVYSVGPLTLVSKQILPTLSMGSNLWKEDLGCLQWLQGKPFASVVYVNFGSITVITDQQLLEFAWGLANSGHDFLWVIRPDLVEGDSSVLPEEFLEETKNRGLLASWCPQEKVLSHPAVGGFLTHCGWNSTLESICGGVPMLCRPFFADQPTNCRYMCMEWGIGMEIDSDVKRKEVEGLIRELMGGEKGKGKAMREKALRWKEAAICATKEGGSSYDNVERLVKDLKMLHV